MNSKRKLSSFIKQENNVLRFDFAGYKQSLDYETLLRKIKIDSKYTPIKLYKIFRNINVNPSLSFEDFLAFLKNNNLWNEKESIKNYIYVYIKKYGPLKIFYVLKNKQYKVESIKDVLRSIPKEEWFTYAFKNLKSKTEKLRLLDPIQRRKKAYQYLHSLGYPKKIIKITLKKFQLTKK